MMSGEPDYEAAVGLIRHLPTEELRDLVNNDDKLAELMKDLPQVSFQMLVDFLTFCSCYLFFIFLCSSEI